MKQRPCNSDGRQIDTESKPGRPSSSIETPQPRDARSPLSRARAQGRALSLLGTALVWAPVIGLAVFAVHGAATHHPLPLPACAYLLFAFRLVACLGGLFLSLGAKRVNLLSRIIGWTTLAVFCFSIVFVVLSGQYIVAIEPAKESRIITYSLSGSFVLTLSGMFALNALSVLFLIRLYGQKDPIKTNSAM